MDLFKSQFDRVRQQLAGLTPSQKMLSFALVAIMAMTLAWFGKYAGSPEMVPLLTQAMTPEELGRVETQLRAAGIQTKSSADGRLLVPADAQTSAMATLSLAGSLPKNISSGFDDMIKQLTAWDGQDRQSAVFNHGKELTLERIIGALPGVDSATVVLSTDYKRHLSRPDVEPKASVNVRMKDGSVGNKQLVDACTNLVAGAEAALSPTRVTVQVGGKHWPAQQAGDAADLIGGASLIDLQAVAEEKLTRKLSEHLGYVEGLRVSVTMKVNGTSQSSEQTIYKKDDSIITEQETTSHGTESTSAAPAANESGVLANVQGPVAVGGSGGGGQNMSETKDTAKMFIAPGVQKIVAKTAAGEAVPVGASVRVPRSYFAAIIKGNDPAAKDADPAAIEKLIAKETESIRRAVIACTQIKTAEMVTVEPYADLVPLPRNPEVVTASVVTMAGGHAKEIALGGLALVSLFMMSMMVRKGAPAVAGGAGGNAAAQATAAAIAAAAARYDSGEPLAGEVAGGTLSLDGVELDDDALKAQQMLGQVTAMVGDNPDAAASLIKRWMNQR